MSLNAFETRIHASLDDHHLRSLWTIADWPVGLIGYNIAIAAHQENSDFDWKIVNQEPITLSNQADRNWADVTPDPEEQAKLKEDFATINSRIQQYLKVEDWATAAKEDTTGKIIRWMNQTAQTRPKIAMQIGLGMKIKAQTVPENAVVGLIPVYENSQKDSEPISIAHVRQPSEIAETEIDVSSQFKTAGRGLELIVTVSKEIVATTGLSRFRYHFLEEGEDSDNIVGQGLIRFLELSADGQAYESKYLEFQKDRTQKLKVVLIPLTAFLDEFKEIVIQYDPEVDLLPNP
ncbi:MAG: hypothetical protein ACPGN3_11615 [Opitutales bacterium]